MYIGIDLGGTNIAAGLVDDRGTVLKTKSLPTHRERPIGEIIEDMANLARSLAEEEGHSPSEISAVGIGCPGTVDSTVGEVIYSNNIVMHHVPMAKEFQKHLPLPVHMENDANAAAFGEYITNGKGVGSFVFLTLGTGVGGGIILDGSIWRGFNGAGAEIGHQTLIYNGEPCTCGRRGCLEAYASVSALIRQTEEAMKRNPNTAMHAWVKQHGSVTGRTAFVCAKDGDKTALEVRDRYIEYVAEGICSIINVLQPEMLFVGGGISREGETLMAPIRAYCEKYDFNKHCKRTEIRTATLYGDAGIVGAAMAAKQALEKGEALC